ncbi:hypothetical protein [Streptomyces sp. NPDC058434]|uniref:hypothetical protein n=1 Tax=Streptomyces sp. NPDC058434 TaxID=3346498 RepID=UPI003652D915
MPARRKAALEPAAARMAERRREAEEAEAERQRKEAAFDELVADFELAVQEEAATVAEVEEELARVRVRVRGRERIDAAKVAAAQVVLALLGREHLAADGSNPAPEKGKADGLGKAAVPKETTGGPVGPGRERDGGRVPGQAGAGLREGSVASPAAAHSGSAPAAAPPVTAPAVPGTFVRAGPVRSPGCSLAWYAGGSAGRWERGAAGGVR